VLENDVAHAGFWGTYVPHFDDQTASAAPLDVPTAVPDPCLAYNPVTWTAAYVDDLIGMPVQVYDDATVCAGIITNRQANTDVLIVRHAEPCVAGGPSPNCDAMIAGRFISSRPCA
jgi:type IV pilus assembly protein PilW